MKLVGKQVHSRLKELLEPLFGNLERENVAYCVCGNYDRLPETTEHDVDIWTDDLEQFQRILHSTAREHGFNPYLINENHNGAHNFFYSEQNGEIAEILRIDVLTRTALNSVVTLVSEKRIKESRRRHRGFMVAGEEVEAAMHLLYPLLHYGYVKQKYREKISANRSKQQFKNILDEALGIQSSKEIRTLVGLEEWKTLEGNAAVYRRAAWKKSFSMAGWREIKGILRFCSSAFDRLIRPSGLFVAFIGLDGAGKSTIIRELDAFFRVAFLRTNRESFYWRPFFLPRLRRFIPFAKKQGNLGSPESVRELEVTGKTLPFYFGKFAYYWLDYILGRVKYQVTWSLGGVVVFDRYYHDHVVYPERFGFFVPKVVLEIMGRVVPKPDIVFFLSVPKEVSLERKGELNEKVLEKQIEEYERLVEREGNVERIEAQHTKDEVMGNIVTSCLRFMSERLVRRGKTAG